jgi:polyribonucleotide 5'-hydroxyl-kinase
MIDRDFKEKDHEETHKFRTEDLPKETEFRIRLQFTDSPIHIKLLKGQAEICGAEMTEHYWYRLPTSLSLSVYTWCGCQLKLSSPKDCQIQAYKHSYAEYEENPNYFLANCFMNINFLREKALDDLRVGPKVLVMGSPFSGKTTICRTLINYSLKLGWNTVYTDLDTLNNEFGSYGTIQSCVLDKYMPYDFKDIHKVSYFCGYSRIESHFKHYFEAVGQLMNS